MNKLLVFVVCQVALGAGPVLTELQPRGAQQGKTFTLNLIGRDLPAGSRIVTTLPAVFTPLTGAMGKGLPFMVEPKGEIAVGTYPVRVETPQGISNILFFTVGAFPEIAEERHKSISTIQEINQKRIASRTPKQKTKNHIGILTKL